MGVERDHVLQHRPAHQLVEGVVAAHVLPDGDQLTLGGEQAGGVQAAGRLEDALGPAQPLRQRVQHLDGDRRSASEHLGAPQLEGVERRLAAHPAGAGGEEVAFEGLQVGKHASGQLHVDDVELLVHVGVGAVGDAADVVAAPDDPFGEQEAHGQLEVGTGRPHGDGEGAALVPGRQPDLERLLGGHVVGAGPGPAVLDHPDQPLGSRRHPVDCT